MTTKIPGIEYLFYETWRDTTAEKTKRTSLSIGSSWDKYVRVETGSLNVNDPGYLLNNNGTVLLYVGNAKKYVGKAKKGVPYQVTKSTDRAKLLEAIRKALELE